MVIKDALSILPARPVLYLVPLIVVIVLTFYYRERYNNCVDIKSDRAELVAFLTELELPAQFHLQAFTGFRWDKVRIVARLDPGTVSVECPFDWNWPAGQREQLIADGLLSALIFGQQGRIVRYLELRNDEVAIRGAEHQLTPDTAVFDVEAGGDGGVTLTLGKP